MWLLFVFILVPMIEIGLFIEVGGLIGLWPTMALVLGSAVIGSWLLRSQGLQALANFRHSAQSLRDPTESVAHGLLIIFAGLLCLTPGFFTDAIGLALLVPPIRRMVITYAASRVQFVNMTPSGGPYQRPDEEEVIDGDYTDLSSPAPNLPPRDRTGH
ncbi:MAG: FxsA family protein [Paracoccaceae bacterium]